MIDIICAMGTIACAVNATKVNSFSGMLLWSFIGALELIGTIRKVMEIFA